MVDVLLQVHIAREETKFGLDAAEVGGDDGTGGMGWRIFGCAGLWEWHRIRADVEVVREEFRGLKGMLDRYFPDGGILSMGMSADYEIAIEEGSNMVRIGSLLFGDRGQKR